MRKQMVALLAGAMLMMATSAMAIPMLDFGLNAPTSGSISYAGGAAPLVGTNINVDTVIGMDTGLNDFALFNILFGTLNFTTGSVISSDATSVSFGAAPSGSIALTGTVDVNGNGIVDAGDISGTLLSGNFGGVSITTNSGQFRLAGAAFADIQNSALSTLYGLQVLGDNGNPAIYDGTFNLSFFTSNDNNLSDGFSSSRLLSGDLTNAVVPEPGTMMLFGMGMLGLAVYGKRRMNKEA